MKIRVYLTLVWPALVWAQQANVNLDHTQYNLKVRKRKKMIQVSLFERSHKCPQLS